MAKKRKLFVGKTFGRWHGCRGKNRTCEKTIKGCMVKMRLAGLVSARQVQLKRMMAGDVALNSQRAGSKI